MSTQPHQAPIPINLKRRRPNTRRLRSVRHRSSTARELKGNPVNDNGNLSQADRLILSLVGLLTPLVSEALLDGEKKPKKLSVDRPLLNGKELCKALNVTAPTLRKFVSDGMPCLQVSGEHKRYCLEDCFSWWRKNPQT